MALPDRPPGPRAFSFEAVFGANRAPYRILGDGGVILSLELPEDALELATQLVKVGKGKELRVLIEVREQKVFAAPKDTPDQDL